MNVLLLLQVKVFFQPFSGLIWEIPVRKSLNNVSQLLIFCNDFELPSALELSLRSVPT